MSHLSLSNSDGWGSLGSDGDWGSTVSGITLGSDGNWGSFSDGVSLLGVSDWGSDGLNLVGNGGNWLVDGVAGLLNDWGLNNLVDWVDLVGLGNWVGLFNLNGVGLGNVGLVDDLLLDWDWVGDWDLNGVTVDLEFGLDASHDWGDLGVGADWSGDLFLGNGISWSWAVVIYAGWDDWASWFWDDWWSNCDGVGVRLWLSSDVRVSGLLFNALSSDDVLVSGNNLLASDLNGAGSNDSLVNDSLGNSWAGMDCFVNGSQWGSCNGNWCGGKACIPDSVGLRWGSTAKGDQSEKNQELCHCQLTD